MATKISELPTTTTPPSTVEIPVVDSGTTKKATLANLTNSGVNSRFGWFDAGHAGATQTGIGTTSTKVLVDGNLSFQGGYSYLPEGLVEADVYDKATSRIKTDWLDDGQMILLRVTGEITTSAANTAARIALKFYDTNDSPLFTLGQGLGYFKSATDSKVSASESIFISSSLAAAGSYIEVEITFDTGVANEINMGGFTCSVLY